jgi:protein-tyrosine-phosphatase
VNPFSIETLENMGMKTTEAHSKSWEEFARPGASPIELILTVCDSAANESCPIWPGKPVTAHWGLEDPAAVEGSDDEKRAAFRHAAKVLRARIERLISLPIDRLDAAQLRDQLRQIGRS